MCQLDAAEKVEVVTNCDHLQKLKFSKALPFAFTEYGAVALANVLASNQAVEMGIYVVRTFVQLRQVIEALRELADKVTPSEPGTTQAAYRFCGARRQEGAQCQQGVQGEEGSVGAQHVSG